MYENKFSVSNNKSKKHANYTYDFKLADIRDFSDIKDGGFTMSVFSGGHRKSEFLVGMTNLGYIDIDADFEPKFGDDMIQWCNEMGFGLSRSGSNSPGKYRIIFKRDIEVVVDGDDCVVIWWGLEQYKTNKVYISSVIRYILQAELGHFLELLDGKGNPKNIDVTSANPAMHSKELGEVLLDFNSNELETLPNTIYDYSLIGKTLTSNAEVGIATQSGLMGHFSVKTKDGKETIRLISGNCFKARVGMDIIDVGIADCIKKGVHIMDPIEHLNGDLRCLDDDAYMPFIVNVKEAEDGGVMFITSGGQHNRNYSNKSIILIVFREDQNIDEKYKSEITVDDVVFEIDEKNKRYRKKA